MKTNNRELKNIITKREVTNLFKKIGNEILTLKTEDEICKFIYNLIPDVKELGSEIFEDDMEDDFVVDFIIPRKYTGKHTKAEFLNAEEDFKELVSLETVNFSIYKKRDRFEIYANVWFTYRTEWSEEEGRDLLIKSETIEIPLECRVSEIENLKKDILGLSDGTIATLISEENIGSASSMYLLIDEVQKRFFEYTVNYIELEKVVPVNWVSAWRNFKNNNSIKDIAYDLGIDKSKVEPNYEIYKNCEEEILRLKSEIKEELSDDMDFSKLSKASLKTLCHIYALSVLMRHCSNNRKDAINKVMNETIPNILEDKYDEKFYIDYAEDGYDVLKQY